MKSEPDVFSIEDLRSCKVTCWDGVRNFQARNFMRDEMKVGDGIVFYHSNGRPSGIAGLAKVVREGYPDFTAFDPNDPHYDPKSDKAYPAWYMVDVEFLKAGKAVIPISRLRTTPGLKKMMLFRQDRLSVQPLTPREWKIIQGLLDRRS
jgi:predicted RNA-binding protein with PUA-like domain